MSETAADIAADLVVLREARTKLAAGQRIQDVWRGGRRMALGKVTLDELNRLIGERERDLAAAEAAEAGRNRRRPIRLGWPN